MPEYRPYDQAHSLPSDQLIVVDCHYPRGLALAHLYEERVPDELRSNTSTECVLKAIELGALDGRTAVTCNHWDIDGFLAVWALLNPDFALQHRELLTAAAMLGDFREFNPHTDLGRAALKLCALLNAEEAANFCLPFGDLDDATIEYQVAERKFAYFLPRFAEWLRDIDRFSEAWRPEHDTVLRDLDTLRAGDASVEEADELGISILRTDKPLHCYSVCSSVRGGAVLSIIRDRPYVEFEYRYETRVGRLDKQTIARHDLSPLAEHLTALEAPGIVWTFDSLLLGGPMLRPESTTNRLTREECYQSPAYRLALHPELRTTIDPELIAESVLSTLRSLAAQNTLTLI